MAPSASTAALLAMGDALALSVLKARNFTREDFAKLHPAGSIGRGLMQVTDAMRKTDKMVVVRENVAVCEALALMARPPRNGAAVIADSDGRLRGIFTHGDFGRLVLQDAGTIAQPIGKHMISPCKFIRGSSLVVDGQQLMHEKKINALPVVDDDMKVLGLLDIQDLV